jgi:hypothetical protein
MHDLFDCMHPGVRPARTCRDNVGLRKFFKRRLQLILNGVATWLGLPSMPGRAIILNTEDNAFQLESDLQGI